MLEAKDITFTRDIEKQDKKEFPYKILSNPENVVDFTFSMGPFMLATYEPIHKQLFKDFGLEEIKVNLIR